MLRTLRSSNRDRGSAPVKEVEVKRGMDKVEKVRQWEKRWVAVADTTMKIYKWVPMSQSNQNKARERREERRETRREEKENVSSNISLENDDSNSALSETKRAFTPDSFSEDSNSNSEPLPMKKVKPAD